MKIYIGDYEVYSDGTIISLPDEAVRFLIEGLTFEMVFKDDPEFTSQKVEAKQSEDKKAITLTFTNFNNDLGISNAVPLPLGFFDNKELFLNYRIHSINPGPGITKTGKTIHYTWFTKRKEVQNG